MLALVLTCVVLSGGCGGSDGPPTLASCERLAGAEQDRCLGEVAQGLVAADPAGALEVAGTIADPLHRDLVLTALIRESGVEGCEAIGDRTLQESCWDLFRRPHLWILESGGASARATPYAVS